MRTLGSAFFMPGISMALRIGYGFFSTAAVVMVLALPPDWISGFV